MLENLATVTLYLADTRRWREDAKNRTLVARRLSALTMTLDLL
jgi:hypothetical protein